MDTKATLEHSDLVQGEAQDNLVTAKELRNQTDEAGKSSVDGSKDYELRIPSNNEVNQAYEVQEEDSDVTRN